MIFWLLQEDTLTELSSIFLIIFKSVLILLLLKLCWVKSDSNLELSHCHETISLNHCS